MNDRRSYNPIAKLGMIIMFTGSAWTLLGGCISSYAAIQMSILLFGITLELLGLGFVILGKRL